MGFNNFNIKKFIAVIIAVLSVLCMTMVCVVLYNFTTVSRHAKDYTSEAVKIQEETGSQNIILVDFTRASCSDRLFVFSNGEPVYSGAVLHGNGKGNTPSKPVFSNEPGSNCSCLGLFKVIGTKTMHNGYPCLILRGLSSTNSNAESRGILIHPSLMVSLLPFELENACFPLTNSSNGCFAVSYHTYKVIEKLQSPIYLYAKYDL